MAASMCCVKSCSRIANVKTGCFLYLLPSTQERRTQWLEALNRSDLIGATDTKIYVCNNHFQPDMFQERKSSSSVKKLKLDACPTLDPLMPATPSCTTTKKRTRNRKNTEHVKMKLGNVTAQDLADPVKKVRAWKIMQEKLKELECKVNELNTEKNLLKQTLEEKQNTYSMTLDKILKHFKRAKYLSVYKKDKFVFVYRNGSLVWEFKKDELKHRTKPVYRKYGPEDSDEEEEDLNKDNSGSTSEMPERDEESMDAPAMEVKEEILMDEDVNYRFPETVKMET